MTPRLRHLAAPWAMLTIALLSGCGTPSPTRTPRPAAQAPAPAATDEIRAFERQQRDRAVALEEQGALADAAATWEVLVLLRPGEYDGRLASLQKRIDTTVQDYLARARFEIKGNLPLSEQLYLSAVALQPQNKEAGDALRAIERARIRQEHLLKPGKTLSLPAETGKRTQPAPPPVPGNSLLMEQASNLASQGDIDEAIDQMAGQLKAAPNDQAARDLLAELHYKKAWALQPKDPAGAQAAVKRCLKVSPRHPGCNSLLKLPSARPAASGASNTRP
jgi:tetratricopeptide (TPR) repeat protein